MRARSCSALVGVCALICCKVSPMPKAGGQWNTLEIKAKNNHLTVKLNGVVTADAIDNKFSSGYLALQFGSGVVKFRKVLTRPI